MAWHGMALTRQGYLHQQAGRAIPGLLFIGVAPRSPSPAAFLLARRSGGDRLQQLADLLRSELAREIALTDDADQSVTVDHG